MILFLSFLFFTISSKYCEIDDYFCLYFNKIEDRWNNPQYNYTNIVFEQIENLTKNVQEFQLRMNNQSNLSIILDDELSVDINSKYESSYLLRKVGENAEDDKIHIGHIAVTVFSKIPPSIKPDFGKGYKINGNKGIFYYMFKEEISLHKIAIKNIPNLDCSVKLYTLQIGNQTYKPSPLSRDDKGIQEYVLPEDQICPGFKIEIHDNFGDNFTCLNGLIAFRQA